MLIIPSLLSEKELTNDIAFCAVMGDKELCTAILERNEAEYAEWVHSTVEYDV